MNELASRGLVPPRPNLGPEPWADDPSIMRILVAIGRRGFLDHRLVVVEAHSPR